MLYVTSARPVRLVLPWSGDWIACFFITSLQWCSRSGACFSMTPKLAFNLPLPLNRVEWGTLSYDLRSSTKSARTGHAFVTSLIRANWGTGDPAGARPGDGKPIAHSPQYRCVSGCSAATVSFASCSPIPVPRDLLPWRAQGSESI